MAKKINVTIPDDLFAQLEEYSEKTAQTKSGFIAQGLRTYIDSLRYFTMLGEMENAFKRLGTNGNNDAETIEELNKILGALSIINEANKNKK